MQQNKNHVLSFLNTFQTQKILISPTYKNVILHRYDHRSFLCTLYQHFKSPFSLDGLRNMLMPKPPSQTALQLPALLSWPGHWLEASVPISSQHLGTEFTSLLMETLHAGGNDDLAWAGVTALGKPDWRSLPRQQTLYKASRYFHNLGQPLSTTHEGDRIRGNQHAEFHISYLFPHLNVGLRKTWTCCGF